MVGVTPYGIDANGTYTAPTGYAFTTIVIRGTATLSDVKGNYYGTVAGDYDSESLSGYFDSFVVSDISGLITAYVSRSE